MAGTEDLFTMAVFYRSKSYRNEPTTGIFVPTMSSVQNITGSYMNGSVSTIVRVRFPGRGRLYTDTFSVRAYIRSRMRYRVRLGREMPCWDRCFSCRTLSRAWRVVLLTTINCYRVRSRCFVCRVLRTRSYARYTRELRSRRR